jgi:hypothetical protein
MCFETLRLEGYATFLTLPRKADCSWTAQGSRKAYFRSEVSQRRVWWWLASRLWCCVVWYKFTAVSGAIASALWWRKQKAPLKRRETSIRLHSATARKWTVFDGIFISSVKFLNVPTVSYSKRNAKFQKMDPFPHSSEMAETSYFRLGPLERDNLCLWPTWLST